ncbi:gamma-glutamyltransferase [Croceibacter atlanticus]|uniref:gamma-glutamyltransferase n=1 Tax=Croceibacter atlanticus TaxID=313588 RepID=UPI001C5EDDDE|nr:gamma-glutamyltransferase [Croceibacter atlanticus]MBW4969014.1 gamma-glutamyltransferase [Croceibacter atlanticus]
MRIYLSLLFLCIVALSCKTKPEPKKTPIYGPIAENAMVVSARAEASKIGSEILEQGGNAFDAMFATEMALAVTFPFAGNLGGGGFMVYRLENGETGALDYREKAPLLSSKTMYQDKNGNIKPNLSTVGAKAVGVPGTIAGIFEAHRTFGSMPIDSLLMPVIKLAEQGYVITKNQKERLEYYAPIFDSVNGKTTLYSENLTDTVKNIALAKTLKRIATNGESEFYTGETGQKLVKFLSEKDGLITLEDLKAYDAVWRDPITFTYDNLKIISMSPPSSGGICLAQIMGMVEPYDLQQYKHNSAKYIQLITEAERRAYADRSHWLGDPDFTDIPLDSLISEAYLTQRMKSFSWDNATKSSNVSHGNIIGYESDETTHYSIIDSYGNAISVTTTLNGAYGSKLYVDELGFFLNNEMDDFSSKPGVPNMFGLIGAEANSIAPEKRMLSSMTPTIVEKDGKLWMSVGTPGGSTIITSVLQTILNVQEFNMTMQEAVDAPRFHHQWLPDVIRFEPDVFSTEELTTLKEKGYLINEEESPIIGKVDGILIMPDGKLEGGADRRGDDTAIGF